MPAQLMLLCLPGHLNSPTRDTALQPLCVHVLAREVLKGIRPETGGLEHSLHGPVLQLPCPGSSGNPEARAQEDGLPP